LGFCIQDVGGDANRQKKAAGVREPAAHDRYAVFG
jgi:hypothetical protein